MNHGSYTATLASGYAEEGKEHAIDQAINIRRLFGSRILDGTKDGVHTSGHADIVRYKSLPNGKPRLGVIPIHKDEYTSYENLTGVSPYKIFTKGQTNIEGINITIFMITPLTSLRFIFALMVFGAHCYVIDSFFDAHFFKEGFVGVSFFLFERVYHFL